MTDAKKWKIQGLWGMPETTFETDPDSDGSDYKFLKVEGDVTFQPMADVLPRDGQTNDLTTQDHVIGAKSGTLSFTLDLKASGTPAGSATAAIDSEAGPLLKAALGSQTLGTGTTVAAASGNGSVGTPMKVASAAGLSKYMAVEVNNEIRIIKSISGTDIVLNKALTSVPNNGDIVYASAMYKKASDGHQTFAFVGKRNGIEYTFLGCKVNVKIQNVQARGIASLVFDVQVSHWTETTKASLPTTVLSGITAVKPPVVKGGMLTIDGTEEVTASLDFDPAIRKEYIDSIAGTNGRAGMEAVESNPVGNFHPYYSATRFTTFLAGTAVELAAAVGTRSNGFALMVPRAQYMVPTYENRNDMVGENIAFAARNNGSDPEWTLSIF